MSKVANNPLRPKVNKHQVYAARSHDLATAMARDGLTDCKQQHAITVGLCKQAGINAPTEPTVAPTK